MELVTYRSCIMKWGTEWTIQFILYDFPYIGQLAVVNFVSNKYFINIFACWWIRLILLNLRCFAGYINLPPKLPHSGRIYSRKLFVSGLPTLWGQCWLELAPLWGATIQKHTLALGAGVSTSTHEWPPPHNTHTGLRLCFSTITSFI